MERVENGEVTRYFYDSLNRLSRAVYPNAEEIFTYDRAGNRKTRTIGDIITRYEYDKRNRLIEKVEGGEHTSYPRINAKIKMYKSAKITMYKIQ